MRNKVLIFLGIICFGLTTLIWVLYFSVTPEIKINGNKNIILKLNDIYNEDGFRAFVLGRDITDDVKVSGDVDTSKVGTYTIKYSVSSKFFKNKGTDIRTIDVIDDTLPSITLTGGEVSIYTSDNYSEPGFSASDNYDGDITGNVLVSNNIDNTKPGSYEVVYSVSDSSNNNVEVKRNVIVKERPVIKNTSSSSSKGNGIAVLMYHFFYDKSKGEVGADSNWMEISSFEEQLKYLDDNDYYFPTWSEISDFVDGKIILPKKSVVITVDDGHYSFLNLAVPVINKYDVKVTSFIVTSWTGSDVISQFRNNKINFQTHTHDMHKGGCSGGHGGLFRCISYNKGLNDLKESIQIIGSSDAIAYPFGDVTDNVLKITKEAGIKLGFTTKYGKVYKGMDKLELPRVRMSKGVSLKSFISAIS